MGGLPPVVFFAALPLKIANGTGSPLRPVAFVPKR
jgi:kynurenine formamidase